MQTHFTSWPKGVPHHLNVPRVALTDYLDVAARRYPDKPAIIFGDVSLTYAMLQSRVNALAAYLSAHLKLAHKDRALLMSQNCPEFVIAFFAILRVGAVVVPISPMSTAAELRFFAQDSGSKIIFTAHQLLAPVKECIDLGVFDNVIVYGQDKSIAWRKSFAIEHNFNAAIESAIQNHLPAPSHEPDANDLAVLPYTSGTTGNPKACRHTHASILASNLASQVWRGLHVDSIFLCVAPLFHMLGLQNGMNLPLTLGATVVMLPRWNALEAINLIESRRVTVWAAPPAMVIDLFSHPAALTRNLSSLTVLSGGGAAMPPAISTMLAERFSLHYNEAYGLSETAAFLHANPLARGKRQCLGIPTQGVESLIIDPDTLRPMAQGDVGELVTRGPQMMLGYWSNQTSDGSNPQADAQAFIQIDGKRYFRTGDLAYSDNEGYFFMRDRLKRMINVSGYKVWPAEVETRCYEHPAIQEACIIAAPDAKQGEMVKAILVLKPSHIGQLTAQEFIEWCRQNMSAYKVPRAVAFVDTLPKSSTGKIAWRAMQDEEFKKATQ